MTNGGALYLLNVKSMIIENSEFSGNRARLKGGALFTICDETVFDCTLKMAGVNTFTSNYANESGGAIYWSSNEPEFKTMNDI